MSELMTEKIEEKKIKVSYADVIVERIDGKPYYNIKYFDIEKNQGYIGFGSYNLDYVYDWLEKFFDVVGEPITYVTDKGDMISRKALIEEIRKSMYFNPHKESKIAHNHIDEHMHFLRMVQEAPTVYDIDVIYDKLESYLFEKYCIEGDAKIDEIVRSGGTKQ